MTRIILAMLLILATPTAMAEDTAPAPVKLDIGDPAPFVGWLLAPDRASNLIAKIDALRATVEEEKARAKDLVTLYEDALDTMANEAIADVLKASERSWWEQQKWVAPTLFGVGLVMGGCLVYKVTQ